MEFKSTIVILIALLGVSFLHVARGEDSGSSEKKESTMTCWQTYEKYPSTENALKLYQSLPAVPQKNVSDYGELLNTIFKRASILERQIYSGDANAAKVAFKLYTISDGEYQETLDIILGGLIRINPRLFLEELKFQKQNIKSIPNLVGNFGPEYVDKIEAHNMERDLRVKALQTITEPSLMSLRDECVAALLK